MRNNLKQNINTVFRNFSLLIMVLSIASCTRQIAFQKSSVVPAARGSVKVNKDNNDNYSISISIRNLAEPSRLTPSKQTYVVWMETRENATLNIGQINSSMKFMSNKLKASFSAVSSSRPTKIFLTAEDDGSVQSPNYNVILVTNSF